MGAGHYMKLPSQVCIVLDQRLPMSVLSRLGLSRTDFPLHCYRHQRGINQTLWIALAVRCRLEDTFGQQGLAHRRSLLRRKVGPCVVERFPQHQHGLYIEMDWLLRVHCLLAAMF